MVDAYRSRRAAWPRPVAIAVDWAVTIVVAVAVVLAVKTWVITPYRIPSPSMEPALHCARPTPGCLAQFSDRGLACRACYWFSSPARGDIVVFHAPKDACGVGGTFVKRLVGLPGETVAERDGRVFVDGKPLVERYVKYRDNRTGVWHVPKGSYFFMGDNRAESCDSRTWGSVPRGSIIGKLIVLYWPLDRIGTVP